MLKNGGATTTIPRLTVASGTQGNLTGGVNSKTYTLAGTDWQVEAGAILGFGSPVDGAARNITCSAPISGAGTIAVAGNGAYSGKTTLSGNLSGFTGRINVSWPLWPTAAGFAAAKTTSHVLVFSNVNAVPTATPDGNLMESAMIVTADDHRRFRQDRDHPGARLGYRRFQEGRHRHARPQRRRRGPLRYDDDHHGQNGRRG